MAKKICKILSCHRKYSALGFCRKHYNKMPERIEIRNFNEKMRNVKRNRINSSMTVEDYKRIDWSVDFTPVSFVG